MNITYSIFYILILVLPTILLIFRLRRLQMFHKIWVTQPAEIEGRIARTNFFIHLVICIILFFMAGGALIASFFYFTASMTAPH